MPFEILFVYGMIVADMVFFAADNGLEHFGMFEFAPFGLIIVARGCVCTCTGCLAKKRVIPTSIPQET